MRISSEGSAANRKHIANDLNLTSFIDILSMLIFFLIFNMALNEVASIQTNMGSDKAAVQKIAQPVKEIPAELKITLTDRYVELLNRGQVKRLPVTTYENFDWAPVEDFVKTARAQYPQKKDFIVQSSDKVPYQGVIKAMDSALSQNFKELVVMGAE